MAMACKSAVFKKVTSKTQAEGESKGTAEGVEIPFYDETGSK